MKIRSAFLFLFFIVLITQGCGSDDTENLGNGYFYRNEGDNIKDILCERPKGGEIPSTVISFVYNKQLILAKQKPNLPQDPLYDKKYEYKESEGNLYYWIIIKDRDIVYGPLNLQEYKELRVKYKIPNKLRLE